MGSHFESFSSREHDDSPEFGLLEESRTIMRHELDSHPVGKWEILAHKLGVDDSFLSKWTQRESRKDFFPLFRLVRWTKVVGPGLLRWIARQCGFELIAMHPHIEAPEPVALVALFARKSGAVLAKTIDDITSQGIWDREERFADLKGWLQIQSTVNGIVDGISDSLRRAS